MDNAICCVGNLEALRAEEAKALARLEMSKAHAAAVSAAFGRRQARMEAFAASASGTGTGTGGGVDFDPHEGVDVRGVSRVARVRGCVCARCGGACGVVSDDVPYMVGVCGAAALRRVCVSACCLPARLSPPLLSLDL